MPNRTKPNNRKRELLDIHITRQKLVSFKKSIAVHLNAIIARGKIIQKPLIINNSVTQWTLEREHTRN